MSIIMIPTYEIRCDGSSNNQPCFSDCNPMLSRQELAEELESAGWLKKGWKWYCPDCRKQFDKKG